MDKRGVVGQKQLPKLHASYSGMTVGEIMFVLLVMGMLCAYSRFWFNASMVLKLNANRLL